MFNKEDWERAVEFHGHVCPGLAIGFKASVEALQNLKEERSEDEEMVAIVENDACGVDAVQWVTGCTMGKGNLIFRDVGKQAFSFVLRKNGKGLRYILKPGALTHDEHRKLMERVIGGKASREETEKFRELHDSLAQKIIQEPLEDNFTQAPITITLPPKARIFPTLTCSFCQEGVMEPRAKVKDGEISCPDCADEYKARVLCLSEKDISGI